MDWKRSCYDVVKQQFNDKKSDELRSSCGIHFIRDQPPDPRADPGNFGGVQTPWINDTDDGRFHFEHGWKQKYIYFQNVIQHFHLGHGRYGIDYGRFYFGHGWKQIINFVR